MISHKHDPSINARKTPKKTVLHSIEQTKKILACRLAMKKVKRWAAKSRQQTPKFEQSQSFHSTEQTCLRTLTHCVFNVLEETKKPKFERNFHLENFFSSRFRPVLSGLPPRVSQNWWLCLLKNETEDGNENAEMSIHSRRTSCSSFHHSKQLKHFTPFSLDESQIFTG